MKSTISEFIPLSIPHLAGNEWTYIKECLDTNWVSSVGSFVNRFEEAIAEYTGIPYAVATMNGTAALHLSLRLAGVQARDYVIAPNLTFVASINSISYAGAEAILIDCQEKDWQMDLDLLESFLMEKTEQKNGSCKLKENGRKIGAIMPVHIIGNMGDINRLIALANRFHIPVVEDATEALGSFYAGKHAGGFGQFGTLSFNGNKIITTGGGGMILTHDEALAKKAKHLTTQAKASHTEYFHDEVGYNYRLVNILAAMGVAQMERFEEIRSHRHQIAALYRERLNNVGDIRFPVVDTQVNPNNWLITIRTSHKQALLDHLNGQRIQARPFWVPMNQLPMYNQSIYIQKEDMAGQVYDSCLSLPSSASLTEAQVHYVCDSIQSIFS